MSTPDSLVSACVAFASEVSGEATERVIEFIAAGQVHRARALLTGDAQARLERLLAEWRDVGESVSSAAVAAMLNGASRATAAERQRQQVELVWSGPTTVSSTLRSTGPALLELIDGARECVYVVAFAAYKVPQVRDAVQAATERGVRVVFVLESSGVSGGKVDFDPLPHLAGDIAAPEVYVWPRSTRPTDSKGKYGTLHAKFAVADKSRLLVSSANLTEYAFNLNIELGVLITGGSAAEQATEQVDELIRRGVFRRAYGDRQAGSGAVG